MVTAATIKKGYKKTDLGVIPEDWEVKPVGSFTSISVGRDLKEENYSTYQDDKFKYPVYSNTVSNYGLYGYYDVAEYNGDSLTIVGRGVGLGTAFSRSGGYSAIGRLLVLFPDKNIDATFLTEYINHKVKIFSESGGIPQLTGMSVAKYCIPLPPTKSEQSFIATVLSNTDVLIEHLEKLIAKKKAIKQGTGQQLLTGKRRLPGFSGEWETNVFGSITEIKKGEQLNKSELTASGEYPDWNGGIETSGYTDKWNMVENTITISEGGNSCGFVNYCKTNFWLGGHCYALKIINTDLDKGFLYQFLKFKEKSIMGLRIGSGLPNIQKKSLNELELFIPKDKTEQSAIAAILSDMDAEIESLAQKRNKYIMLKQGMMQELLTGKTRLVKPESYGGIK